MAMMTPARAGQMMKARVLDPLKRLQNEGV